MQEKHPETDKEQAKSQSEDEIETPADFVTLGMCILDDIYQDSPPKLLHSNVLGGAGIYAALGARIFREQDVNEQSGGKSVGVIVHEGCDFPMDAKVELESWHLSSVFIKTPQRLTTRGKNIYSKGVRSFEFITPKIQVDHTMLLSGPFLMSKSYHLICTPTRCIELVKGIMSRRKAFLSANPQLNSDAFETPLIVWEPMEHCCRPSQLPSVLEAMDFVDVFSPNDHELSALFKEEDQGESTIAQQDLQQYCKTLLTQGFGVKPSAVVIRMGEDGCFVASHTRNVALPAYHTPLKNVEQEERTSWKNRVADPTGGGNAFLGGYCIGLLMDGWRDFGPGLTPFEGGALHGSIAASFAIEQSGMPKLTYHEGKELWNGERSLERLDVMRERVEKLDIPKVSDELFDNFSPWKISKRPASPNTTPQRLVHRRSTIKDARTRVS